MSDTSSSDVDWNNQKNIEAAQAETNARIANRTDQISASENLKANNSFTISQLSLQYDSATDPSVKDAIQAQINTLNNSNNTLSANISTLTEANAADQEISGYYSATLNTNFGVNTSSSATPITTIDPNTASSLAPVSSGSGSVIASLSDTSASAYANQTLSSSNADLVDSNATLTNTLSAVISQQQLAIADSNATAAWNTLSTFTISGDTTSTDYQIAKINAIGAQNEFEIARNNLEDSSTTGGLTGSALDARAAAFMIDGITSDTTASSTLNSNNSQTNLTLDIAGTSSDLLPTSSLDDSLSSTTFTSSGSVTASASDSAVSTPTTATQTDKRIRIRAKDSSLYSDSTSAMFPLNSSSGTNGVMFPYTPAITYNHAVNYQMMEPTHSNTSYALYTNTPALQIQIVGQFTAQNQAEGQYLMAAMHFFRTASKMHFGENDTLAGLPPPVLTLSGYGNFMFNDLDCIMTNFQMDLPNNVDYVEVTYNGFTAWVPSITTLTVSLVVQQTPKKQRTEFDFTKFANGSLLTKGGWI